MTVVLNTPSWWPEISSNIFNSYWIVAAAAVVVYDWALTLGQEIELIWRQHWSLMTLQYLVVHTLYCNTIFRHQCSENHAIVLEDRYSEYSTTISQSHLMNTLICRGVSNIMYYAKNGTNVVIAAMLGAIMIARLYAMYQGSRMMLTFLVIIFLAVNTACGVIAAIAVKYVVAEELILSGTYTCYYKYEEDVQLLISMVWMLNTAWELLALCLSVWIAAKHFHDLRLPGSSTGTTIRDCFRVLLQSHVLYFSSFLCVSCLQFTYFSPKLVNSNSTGVQTLYGALEILLGVQMFVLGPRLILSVREYYAKLVVDSDSDTSITSIVFLEQDQILVTGGLNGAISSTDVVVVHHQHSALAHTHPSNMTVVLNDPTWWPSIDSNILLSYWMVAAAAVVVYDWVLTLGQELIGQTPEELILSGTYMCYYGYEGNDKLLYLILWTVYTAWEVLALCLSVWIAVKHFRDLRRLGLSTGSTIGDCFRVLIQSHVVYFASFVCVSCLQLITHSPEIANSSSIGVLILYDALQVFIGVQMFVLGPRLILSVREYHAKLMADSDAETSMNSIVFRERVLVSTSSTV
ncbi:uncharacterized protein EDB93DRAFT_1253852 [Suillus bovinus]|uniref:uncharacterized protein n=1 Tax=Suillus bovinus TaxID=48563 RepID=UPI001B87B151|nr:uncharacterized protein EDB93DRAFT_1253852 [Suillus bovinus]KAG2136555.1 hypothetical protein EDB93DRAFT_1253852 [Suillus bovinus]